MPGRHPQPGGLPAGGLSADEFATRFQSDARVLWAIAAGTLGDPTEAEDVLQEAAVMALGKLDRFESGTNFTAWVGRFVRNVALNHGRKRARRATRPVDPDVLGETAPAPGHGRPEPGDLPIDGRGELLPDQAAFDDRVVEGLRELAPDARAALLLRTVLGLAYREIAGALGIPEGTAMSHVHRARGALRERLEPSEADAARDHGAFGLERGA